METILCYGDSNTYGYNPENGLRYPKEIRWTTKLQVLLGDEYCVVEEGCNGRTTVFDYAIDTWRNGESYLKPCLNSHKPIDIVILMLGTNDLKKCFHTTVKEISIGIEKLVKDIHEFSVLMQRFMTKIILISPPCIGEDIAKSRFRNEFDYSAVDRSREIAKYYKEVALKNNCVFFDASKYVEVSKIDSLHLTPEGHKVLAIELYELIINMKNTSPL